MWKTIVKYPNYEVSDDGKVRNKMTGKVLKERPTNCGYVRVVLYKNKIPKDLSIHRLVAEQYLPYIADKNDVNHKNGNKLDNRVENLEWCTKSENIRHAQDKGLKTYETISTKVEATSQGKTLKFKSYNEAGRFFNCHHDKIRMAVINNKPLYGYEWKLAN